MKEIFSMWKNTRMIVLAALTAAIYAAILIPFKAIPLIPGFTEVRPGNLIPRWHSGFSLVLPGHGAPRLATPSVTCWVAAYPGVQHSVSLATSFSRIYLTNYGTTWDYLKMMI